MATWILKESSALTRWINAPKHNLGDPEFKMFDKGDAMKTSAERHAEYDTKGRFHPVNLSVNKEKVMADTVFLQIPEYIVGLKWWERFLLVFRRSHYIHEPKGEDRGGWIRYKTIFGKVYLLDNDVGLG